MSGKFDFLTKLFCPKESEVGETRVALTPTTAARLKELGIECVIESGAGEAAGHPDAAYEGAGCRITRDAGEALSAARIVISVHPPEGDALAALTEETVTISFLDPFQQRDRTEKLAERGVCAVGLEFIPRTTLAQKMDALSSQANLAGYASVLLAATHLDKILPMMMTPAGTLQPAKFLIVGVGVAGLQAIATARRLGARVTGFDTRPVVKEQVQSLGARFLEIDIGETGQTEQGYAKELTPEQIELQRAGMKRACSDADAIITTAQVFGRSAPRILTADLLAGMRPGSVVVDMAVTTGGNVEGSEAGRNVIVGGVHILGPTNLPATVPQHASATLAANIANFIEHFWDAERGLVLDDSDEIARGSVVARGGRIVHERLVENAAVFRPTPAAN